jgi:serine protease DegQ
MMQLSNQIADLVEAAAPSVVQVQGNGSPASGVVYAPDVVITTARALGRGENPRVRRADGEVLDAELVGIDPATRIAVIKTPALNAPALVPGKPPRIGHIGIAIARSWSNVVTASAGLVSIIGGPLRTGRRRSIEQVIRTSAPMHEGFAGGAFVDAEGGLIGLATAASIRGLGVVIPGPIAWAVASELLRRGSLKRGYLGIAAQPARVTDRQRTAGGVSEALLVVGVKEGTPAADAGLLVGDLLLSLDGHALATPDDLLDLLIGDRVGPPVTLRILRGDVASDLAVTIRER